MRKALLLLFTILLAGAGYAQERLTGLQINPVVMEKAGEINRMKNLKSGLDTIPVTIPFFDDFSSNDVFPSDDRWINNDGFENDDLPVYPVNLGAMTLDAINDSGNMYRNAVPGPMAFIADHLTSRYIRLDSIFSPTPKALTPADSVYLSFFYQPQGRGRAPQNNDSLIMEFLVRPAHDTIIAGDTIRVPDRWRKMWYANGMPLDTFYLKKNKWFAQVLIPVTDSVFFNKNFRFRFFNYVSLASSSEPSWQNNTDQWNLDNVYLHMGRNMNDTVYPELRFVYRPPSLLIRYESMPYPQYSNDPTNEIKDTLDILMTNRDIIAHQSTYNYTVKSTTSSFSKTYNGGNYTILPYTLSPYVSYEKFAHPALPFLIPISEEDSAVFSMTHIVKDIIPGSVIGDTMTGYQRFYNYFAYDDGTPEASYGLTPTGSKLAYRFKLNKSPDTLRAIRIFFNRTLSNASKQFFYLCVWNDNAGLPGDTIYSSLVMPRYADSLNKFVTYHLSPPLAISGTFYVGCIQTTDDNLSIGFDRYNNSQNEILYNSIGVWNNSAFSGSLMIRPVIGKPIPLGLDDVIPAMPRFTLYPNPCNTGRLRIGMDQANGSGQSRDDLMIKVFDFTGRLLMRETYRNEIDISALRNGIYLMEIVNRAGIRTGVSRFIVQR